MKLKGFLVVAIGGCNKRFESRIREACQYGINIPRLLVFHSFMLHCQCTPRCRLCFEYAPGALACAVDETLALAQFRYLFAWSLAPFGQRYHMERVSLAASP